MRLSLIALGLFAVLASANVASAQGFGFPPINSPFGPGGGWGHVNPNPVIHNSGNSTGYVDPHTGRWVQLNNQNTVLHSATDPNRHIIDPGSLRISNSTMTIGNVTYRVTTRRWTSYGRPHHDTKRQVIRQGPGGTTVNTHRVSAFKVTNTAKSSGQQKGAAASQARRHGGSATQKRGGTQSQPVQKQQFNRGFTPRYRTR